MPGFTYKNAKIYFWSNEDEPFHVHVSEKTPTQNGFKIWILKDNTLMYDVDQHIDKKVLGNAIDFIRDNILFLKQKWCDHFRINLSDIKYYK